ncbi:MAG: SprT-like domain-containing protein [Anaerolineae bacterium]
MATTDKYITFEAAYQFLNKRLFDNKLEECVITLNCDGVRKAFFVKNSFKTQDDRETRDEIALNPDTLAGCTDIEILSTLAHEMVHKWQHDYGKPGKNASHNKEWAKAMKRIGLKPFNIVEPDRETEPACAHVIIEDGLFAQVCQELAAKRIKLNRQLQKSPANKRQKNKRI